VAGELRAKDVFINCPFDADYKPLFNAIIFAVRKLRFEVRCALEVDDAGEVRVEKIQRIIEQCRYGIHDISSVALDPNTGLPRFNMPLELGLYLGCRRFGGAAQRRKACLILDSEPYRYRAFISDIAGQDIHSHGGNLERAITEVRDWLVAVSGRKRLPGGTEVVERHRKFIRDLPGLCADFRRKPDALTFVDQAEMIDIWLKSDR
jgi:hypothetical protein